MARMKFLRAAWDPWRSDVLTPTPTGFVPGDSLVMVVPTTGADADRIDLTEAGIREGQTSQSSP